MLRIEVAHTFDVSVTEAFAYITDVKNWPEYWPDFIRIENSAAAGWSNPGDRATVVIKLLNRERALNLEYGIERVSKGRMRHVRKPAATVTRCSP
jgi:hypothetical protein